MNEQEHNKRVKKATIHLKNKRLATTPGVYNLEILKPTDKLLIVAGLKKLEYEQRYIGANQKDFLNQYTETAKHLAKLIEFIQGEGLTNEKG